MLTPTLPADSVCRLLYTGPVGTAGVDAAISLSLAALPDQIITDPNFTDNWRLFVRKTAGISEVNDEIDFTIDSTTGLPTAMVLTLTAASTSNILDLEAVFTPTSVR